MIKGSPVRLIAALAIAMLPITGTAATAVAATPGKAASIAGTDDSTLEYQNISFAKKNVDASVGGTGIALNWRLTDSNPNATYVAGEIDIRMAGSEPGTYIGRAYQIQYNLYGSSDGQVTASGTAQDSSYSFVFGVPKYANATKASWVVVKATALDDQGATVSLSDDELDQFSAVLQAKELVDATPPTYDSLSTEVPIGGSSRRYVYDNGVNGSMGYSLNAQDQQSGFWKGSITLQGPGGQSLRGEFSFTESTDQGESCGNLGGSDDFDVPCGVAITIPAGTTAGTWVVSAITLVDNAGVSVTYSNLNMLPIVVTGNAVVSASGFAASPNPVDNWTSWPTVTLSMSVSGAQQGVTAIYADTGGCRQTSTTPTLDPDGTLSVPILVYKGVPACPIAGIAVVDGAGNVALYGPEYGAPDPGVTITRVPDTTPPVATAASLSPLTVASSQTFLTPFLLTIDITAQVAPVNALTIDVYDASGNLVFSQDGGVPDTLTGQLEDFFSLFEFLPPGVYTVGFTITDAGWLSTSYGTPDGLAMPGGPLQFTVTP